MSKKKQAIPAYKMQSVVDLAPYARNARVHSAKQVEAIAASIKEFGFLNPVIIDGDKGIIAGHGRVMAAELLGMVEVPTLEVVHLSEAQKRAYIIADNKIALESDWDMSILEVELQDIAELDFDISLTGFDDADLFADLGNPLADSSEQKYTQKIEAPIYEPSGDKPLISDLFNQDKANELKRRIEHAALPNDLKQFLMLEAGRFVEFRYDQIANFYAHSNAPTQQAIEDLALVIVDFDKAIESGFISLNKSLLEQMTEESTGG